MTANDEGNELTDVALCYQALGIELDATPLEVERVYRSLSQQYRAKLGATEEVLRQEARQSLELLQVMYERIRGSITYQSAHQEFLKRNAAASSKRPPHHATVQKGLTPKMMVSFLVVAVVLTVALAAAFAPGRFSPLTSVFGNEKEDVLSPDAK